VIRMPSPIDPPIPRLIEAIERHPSGRVGGPDTWILGAGIEDSSLEDWLASAADGRILVVSAMGAHPDARAPRLRRLWAIEERARASGRPTLTLRLGPIVGKASPLWLRLRSRPQLPGRGRALLNPVFEDDVVETVARALDGRAPWEGWFEVVGPEVLALAELAELAAMAPRLGANAGAWEPPAAELAEHRLVEDSAWSAHFGIIPREVGAEARSWA
jgi:uncharacterized protein YbjT (DUF2867 family)